MLKLIQLHDNTYFMSILQFCATRKGTQQAANVLIKDARFVMNGHHKQRLVTVANSLKDAKLKGVYIHVHVYTLRLLWVLTVFCLKHSH